MEGPGERSQLDAYSAGEGGASGKMEVSCDTELSDRKGDSNAGVEVVGAFVSSMVREDLSASTEWVSSSVRREVFSLTPSKAGGSVTS